MHFNRLGRKETIISVGPVFVLLPMAMVSSLPFFSSFSCSYFILLFFYLLLSFFNNVHSFGQGWFE